MKIKESTETQAILTDWNGIKSKLTNQELLVINNKLPQIAYPLESRDNWNILNELWMCEIAYAGFEKVIYEAYKMNELEKNAAITIFRKFKTIEDKRDEVYMEIEREMNSHRKNYMDAICKRTQISASILLLIEHVETEIVKELILLRSNTKAVKELFKLDPQKKIIRGENRNSIKLFQQKLCKMKAEYEARQVTMQLAFLINERCSNILLVYKQWNERYEYYSEEDNLRISVDDVVSINKDWNNLYKTEVNSFDFAEFVTHLPDKYWKAKNREYLMDQVLAD
jgi:hypothetical protein